MKVKTRLTKTELDDLLIPRLILFLSVDLEGSTAFKQLQAGSYEQWLEPFFIFLKEFGSDMDTERRELERQSTFAMPPEPKPWKILGDEVIYVAELKNNGDADFHVTAFLRTLAARNAQARFPLKVKGSAWVAGFPVGNALLPVEGGNSYDYLGASIDVGFRLSKFSSPRRMCISVDLAWLLLGSHFQDFQYGYEGRKELKGVMEKTGYPVIWIDCGASTDHRMEEELLKKAPCDPKQLKAFCAEFMAANQFPKFMPFLQGNGLPGGYAEGVAKTESFLRRVYDVVEDVHEAVPGVTKGVAEFFQNAADAWQREPDQK